MFAVRKRLTLLVAGAALTAGVIGYAIHSARATGIPSPTALSYTGTLLTFGQPDNSTHEMTATLVVSGAQVCSSGMTSVTCVNGQFTIPLPTCTSAIQSNPNVEIQIEVDGTTLGPTSITAVPYAVVAGNISAGGVTGVLAIANGGTGSGSQNFVDLSNPQTVGGAKTFSSPLSVGGIIQSTSGGIEFPDGTIQTSAAADTSSAPVFMVNNPYPGGTYPNNGAGFVLPNVSVNLGSGYSTVTGKFTAPLTGYYSFSYMITASIECCNNNVNDVGFAYNGSVNEAVAAVTTCWTGSNTFSSWCPASSTAIFHMSAGDTMQVVRACCDDEQPLEWRATFNGHYLHP